MQEAFWKSLHIRSFSRETMDVPSSLEILRTAVASSSQGYVAGEIGLEPSAISRWLSGETKPTGKNLLMLIEWAEATRLKKERAEIEQSSAVSYRSLKKPASHRNPQDDAFYDGVIHSLAVFNEAAGQLISEVQAWRSTKRGLRVAETPKQWLTNEEMDADHAAFVELEEKVTAAKAAKKARRKSAG